MSAITHRQNPIFQAALTGMPTTENHILKQLPLEATFYWPLKKEFPGATAVHFPAAMLADVKKMEPFKRLGISLEGKDFKAGRVRQTMVLALTPKGNQTEIGFETNVNVFGRLGTLGYPFVKKKAEAVIQEFGERSKAR